MKLHDRVMFVGDRPSPKRNVDMNVAFVGAPSYKTLLEWMYRMDVDVTEIEIINAYDIYGSINPSLEALLKDYRRVVTLGEAAGEAVAKACPGLKFFKLPHPSGLNRKINDKTELTQALARCKRYIYKKS